MEGYYKNGQLKQLTEDGIRTHYFENGKVKATGVEFLPENWRIMASGPLKQ